MLSKIKPLMALHKVDEYLEEINRLLNLEYAEGKTLKEILNLKIRNLVNVTFDNAEIKLKEYDDKVNAFFIVAGEEETEEEKKEDYRSRLLCMKTMLEAYKDEIQMMLSSETFEVQKEFQDTKKVFIIHGHDKSALLELEKILKEEFSLRFIILKDMAGRGRPLIVKFEEAAKEASYAFAILTPDDVIKISKKQYLQARPNVIFELGWFFGRLGSEKVCILLKKGTTIHSDLNGISRIEFDQTINDKFLEIKKELQEAHMI